MTTLRAANVGSAASRNYHKAELDPSGLAFNKANVLLPLHLSALLALPAGQITVWTPPPPAATSNDESSEETSCSSPTKDTRSHHRPDYFPFALPSLLWSVTAYLRSCQTCAHSRTQQKRPLVFSPWRQDIVAFMLTTRPCVSSQNQNDSSPPKSMQEEIDSAKAASSTSTETVMDCLVTMCESCRLASSTSSSSSSCPTLPDYATAQTILLQMQRYRGFWGSVVCGAEFLCSLATAGKAVASHVTCLIRHSTQSAFTSAYFLTLGPKLTHLQELIVERCDNLNSDALVAATKSGCLRVLRLRAIRRLEDSGMTRMIEANCNTLEYLSIKRCSLLTSATLDCIVTQLSGKALRRLMLVSIENMKGWLGREPNPRYYRYSASPGPAMTQRDQTPQEQDTQALFDVMVNSQLTVVYFSAVDALDATKYQSLAGSAWDPSLENVGGGGKKE